MMSIYDCINKRRVLEKEHVFFAIYIKCVIIFIKKGDIKVLNKFI